MKKQREYLQKLKVVRCVQAKINRHSNLYFTISLLVLACCLGINWMGTNQALTDVVAAQNESLENPENNAETIVLQKMVNAGQLKVEGSDLTGWTRHPYTREETQGALPPVEYLQQVVLQCQNDLRTVGVNLPEALAKPGTFELVSAEVRSERVVYRVSLEPQMDLSLTARILPNPDDFNQANQSEIVYLVLEIHAENAIESVVHLEEQVRQVLERYSSSKAQTCVNVTAYREGEFSSAERDALMQQMLQVAKAGPATGLIEEELISVTAYTEEIPDWNWVGGKPVNLQISGRYHGTEDRTYFHFGTPWLLISY